MSVLRRTQCSTCCLGKIVLIMTIKTFAPGRVELLGNHTDYNAGIVLAAAINYGVEVSGQPIDAPEIRLHALDLQARTTVPLLGFAQNPSESWANYPLGVVREFQKLGHELGGLELSFHSTLPMGAGLSSSAALEVATANWLRKAFDVNLSPMEVARLCKRAENEFVGVNCGLLDQATSVFGESDSAVFLDCREDTVQQVKFPPGVALLVCSSGVPHVLTGGEYNERREQCFAAAAALGVAALREVGMQQLQAAQDTMEDVVYRRACHVVGEMERVSEGMAALQKESVERFGELMFESHESSRFNFENSTPELDLLVSIARETPGVLGSRLTGGGFGGATVSLVHSDAAAPVAQHIQKSYSDQTGHLTHPMHCSLANGAEILFHNDSED